MPRRTHKLLIFQHHATSVSTHTWSPSESLCLTSNRFIFRLWSGMCKACCARNPSFSSYRFVVARTCSKRIHFKTTLGEPTRIPEVLRRARAAALTPHQPAVVADSNTKSFVRPSFSAVGLVSRVHITEPIRVSLPCTEASEHLSVPVRRRSGCTKSWYI